MKERLQVNRCGGSFEGGRPDWFLDSGGLADLDKMCQRLRSLDVEWPRITVVTPSYNYAQFIEQTIASVQHQNYPNLEYIVCDNFSEDGTRDILAKHSWIDARIEKDKGQADALNRAFATATGEILTWLNADDFYAPMALFRVALEYLKGGADLIAGQVILFNEDGPRAGHLYSLPDGPILEREILDLEGFWLSGQYFYQPEVFFTKEIYQRAGGHIDKDLFYSMDYDLWCRMARAGAHVRALACPLVFFREHDDQKTNDPNDFKAELRAYISRQTMAQSAAPRYAPFQWATRRPRVALISDLGFQYGAGIAHQRIAKAFGAMGCELSAFSMAMDVNPANYSDTRDLHWLKSRLDKFKPDLIILGNLHAAEAEHGWLQDVLEQYPVFFVTHDFYWLTGGVPYPEEEQGDSAVLTQQHGEAAQAIADLIAHPNAFILANSAYAFRKAEAILLSRGFDVDALKTKLLITELGFETDMYFPDDHINRVAARNHFDLPQEKTIVLFPSGSWTDPRKNPKAAIALANLLDPELFHCVFLGEFLADDAVLLPEHVSIFGFIRDGDALSCLFRASDFVFSSSKDETFGQTIVEGALCGALPVSVASGAIPEILAELDGGFQASQTAGTDVALQEIASFMTALAHDPDRLAVAQLRCAMSACAKYSILGLARRLHLALKDSGLVHQIGLMPKVDLSLHGAVPEVLIVPPLHRNEMQTQIAALEHRIEELEDMYKALEMSRSMRITAPLRWLNSVLKAILKR